MPLLKLDLEAIHIDDEASFRHVGVYGRLKDVVRKAALPFCIPDERSTLAHWDAALLLNHTQWSPSQSVEVLTANVVPADALCHRAWHYAAAEALGEHAYTADGLLLGEAVASAFDVYLVGRLVGHVDESGFLESQVPAMRDDAESAGCDERTFERLLERMVAEPEKSFEAVRAMLFDVARGILRASTVDEAAEVLEGPAKQPFGPLLYHYELRNWVLFARALGRSVAGDGLGVDAEVGRVDAELRAATDPVDWLERQWLDPLERRLSGS